MLLEVLDQLAKIERTIRLFDDHKMRQAIANFQRTIATDNYYTMILVDYHNFSVLH